MPRGSRATTALITAGLATVVCVFAAVEAIALAVHRRTVGVNVHQVTQYARTTSWHDPAVLAVGVAAGVAGLLLLAAGLLPPRRQVIELTSQDPLLAVGLPRASLHRLLRAAAGDIDGITTARIRGRRRLRITATTPLSDTTGLADRVRQAATSQLDVLGTRRRHTMHVRVSRKEQG